MLVDGMSFDKYIDNPSGGASVISNRQMYKDMYKTKFEKVLVKVQGRIEYHVYHADDKNDSYYIHFKIPSEVVDNFFYDVVIHLFTHMMPKKASMSLRSYQVEFFSNDPAFVYAHAYAFYKKHLFIKDLETKISRQAITEKGKITNPEAQVWYVKTIYFAYLAMEKYGLFNRATLNMVSKPYNSHIFDYKITHSDKKIRDRQMLASKINDNEEKTKETNHAQRNPNHSTKSTTISKTSKVSTVSKISRGSKISKLSKKK